MSISLQEVNFSAGEVLGSDEMDGDYIYLIAQGQVDVLRRALSSAASEHADFDDDDIESDATQCKYYCWEHVCHAAPLSALTCLVT